MITSYLEVERSWLSKISGITGAACFTLLISRLTGIVLFYLLIYIYIYILFPLFIFVLHTLSWSCFKRTLLINSDLTRISSPQFSLPPGMRAGADTAGGLDVRSKKWLKHPSVCLRVSILKSFHVFCLLVCLFVISAEGDPNPCDVVPLPRYQLSHSVK